VSDHSFYLVDSKQGRTEGFSTIQQAREALLSWVFLQRQAGEAVIEHATAQWSDSRVTRWIADAQEQVVPVGSK
jgi:hypothetical protein